MNKNPIAIPPKAKAKLTALIGQRDQLQTGLNGVTAAIDAVVETMREVMAIPDDWLLTNLDVGFVPGPNDTNE